MKNKNCYFAFTLSLLLVSSLCFAQMKPRVRFIPSETLYEDFRNSCYVLTLGVNGPFNKDSVNLPTLKFPENDCNKFIETIRKQFGYQYKVDELNQIGGSKTDKDFQSAKDILDVLSQKSIKKGDVVLIYFSGHGLNIENHYYFPMIDGNSKVLSTMISGKDIIGVAVSLANKGARVLVFLDTCHSGCILNEDTNVNSDSGYVVIFPATSQNTKITELTKIGGTEFGTRLCEILSGTYSLKSNEISVKTIAEGLSAVIIDKQEPSYNPCVSTLFNVPIIKNVKLIKTYNDYIEQGRSAILHHQFDDAVNQITEARKLEDRNTNTDRKFQSDDLVNELNLELKNFLKEKYDRNNQYIWERLSNVFVNHNYNLSINPLFDLKNKYKYRLCIGFADYYLSKRNKKVSDSFLEQARIFGEEKEKSIVSLGIAGGYPSFSTFVDITPYLDFKIEIGVSFFDVRTANNVYLYPPTNNYSPYGYNYSSWKWRPFIRIGYEWDWGKYFSFTPLVGFSYTRISGILIQENTLANGIGDEAAIGCWSLQGRFAYSFAAISNNNIWKHLQIHATGGYELGAGDENYNVLRKVDNIKNMNEGWRVQGGIIYNF